MLDGGFLEAHPLLAGIFVAAVVAAAGLYVVKRLRGGGAALLFATAAAAVGASACGGSSGTLEVETLSELSVTIGVGQTVRIFAELTAATDQLGAVIDVSVDNGGIVSTEATSSVPALGSVAAIDLIGIAPGTVSLRAFLDPVCGADPSCGGSATVEVVALEDTPIVIDSILPEPAVVEIAGTLRMSVTLRVTPVDADAIVTLAALGEPSDIGLAPDEDGACGAEVLSLDVRIPPGSRSAFFCVTGNAGGTAMLAATLGASTSTVTVLVQ